MMLVAVMCAAFAGQAWGQEEVTIWSEDFSGYSADAVPSGTISMPHTGTTLDASGTLSYSCANGTGTKPGTTAVKNDTYATGTSPEIMIGKKGSGTGAEGGKFTAVIPLDNISGTITLTYYQNANTLSVTSPTEGVSGGQTLKPSEAGQQTTTFTGITTAMKSITIVFQATTTSNVRLDNIVLTGNKVAAGTTAAPTISGNTPFVNSTTVTITNAPSADGAAIYYTLNGDDPTTTTSATCFAYSAPFTVEATTTVKAIAKHEDDTNASSVVSQTFTKVTPINVTAALSAIDELDDNGTIDNQCVSGIVSTAATSISSGKMTYSISVDGTTTNQLTIYLGKGLNNADFSAITDLEVGDQVTVYGQLKKYVKDATTTPEFTTGSYLLSLVEILDNDLTKTDNIALSMASPSTTADATDYFTTSSAGTISYESGNTSVATVSAAGVVTPVAAGSTTITVTQAATSTYKAGEITINVIVAAASLYETEIVVDPTSGSTVYGTPKDVDYLIDDTYDGTIAAVSSNTAVATVAITQHTDGEGTFTITPVAVGTAVITISAPATATCEAADNATYTITVTAPVGGTTAAPAPTAVFTETFAECTSTGGNSGGFGTAGNTKIDTDKVNNYTDNDGWTFSNGYPASTCVKFGGSSSQGQADSPSITVENGKTYTLSFKAAPWNEESSKTMTVAVTGGTINGSSAGVTSSMTAGQWNEFEFEIVASSTSLKLSFNCSANRFFLDDVVVTSGSSIKAKLSASGYATFCSLYPLDFTDYATADYSAWQITDVNTTNGEITFSQITGSVKGGTGLLIKGTANETISLTSSDSDTELSGNKLVGTLAPTYVTTTVGDNTLFGLSGESFKKINSGTIPANKAYLPILTSSLPSGSIKSFTFLFEDATGIRTVEKVSAAEAEAIFNLAGQRIQQPQKGINIINGRKVVVK